MKLQVAYCNRAIVNIAIPRATNWKPCKVSCYTLSRHCLPVLNLAQLLEWKAKLPKSSLVHEESAGLKKARATLMAGVMLGLNVRLRPQFQLNHQSESNKDVVIGQVPAEACTNCIKKKMGTVPRDSVSVPVGKRHYRNMFARILYLVYHGPMKNLRPIKATRLSESVYEALQSAILQGELVPNSTVHDRQLAEVLGVSRTPVRDALHRLECDGLVKPRHPKGWTVAGFAPVDVKEIFDLRRALEPLGLKGLSRNWDEATVQELASLFDAFPDQLSRDRYPAYLERDHNFHSRLIDCSGNRRAIDFYTSLSHQIDRVRHYLSYGYEGRVDESLSEHREICSAIASRDLESATELLLHHLNQVEAMFVRLAAEHQIEQWLSARHV